MRSKVRKAPAKVSTTEAKKSGRVYKRTYVVVGNSVLSAVAVVLDIAPVVEMAEVLDAQKPLIRPSK